MASPDVEDKIFQNLQKPLDPQILIEKARFAKEQELAQIRHGQQRLNELFQTNSSLPCTVSSIRVLNANHTRRGFLARIFNPLLSANSDRPFTFAEVITNVSQCADKLHKLDIFHEPISIFAHEASRADPSSTPTDIDVFLSVKEKSRVTLKTGTEVGNAEGNAYSNLTLRNVFGGAESFNINAALGTRTRSAYQATFDTPLLSNPDLKLEVGGLATATEKRWASHEEVVKGGWTKLRWLLSGGHSHEFEYTGMWRQITGLSKAASPSVRAAAGDSVKSAITHTWSSEQRDNPLLPSHGYRLKTISELAGWGPLQGDVAFWRSEAHTQTAFSLPIPGSGGDNAVTLTTGFRAGLLYPMGLGWHGTPQSSRLNDRFQFGGPTDVRGFRLSGVGPHDGEDAIGGDVYAAGSVNLLFPVPGVGIRSPLRFQLFMNGARSLALKSASIEDGSGSQALRKSVLATITELGNGLPSMAAGLGLVYAHPMARFELNFSLPLTLREGESSRKGLQFGIGMDFM